MQDVQMFKDMAKEMSPEVVLDKVFSAVAPDFQRALLSRPADPAKPVKRPEAMRDPKYFQPAIATVPLTGNMVNVNNGGRKIEPASAINPNPSAAYWTRMQSEDKDGQSGKQGFPFPFFMPSPQRY